MATTEQMVLALTAAARKRRLLSAESARRLVDYAGGAPIDGLIGMRAWLDEAKGLSPDLAKRLKGLLPPEDLPTFGAWTALAHLADGGMGRVWLAGGAAGDLAVVKTIKATPTQDPGAAMERRQRFEREARITQKLEHPNIVRCLDASAASDGSLYLVLEFIDTGDLRDLVEARKRLSEPLALAVLYQVADALATAHGQGLIHRDLKPSNIFVSVDGRAKLADFGLARSIDDGGTRLTMAGALVGSPLYMSPEQIIAEGDLDGRSDLYALGCVLYFCLTGHPPFEGKVQDVLRQHCQEAPPDVRRDAPTVSAATAALITACLDKDPYGRPKDAAVMAQGIEGILDALGVTVDSVIEEETQTANLLAESRPAGAEGAPSAAAPPAAEHAGDVTIVADLSGKAEGAGMSDIFASRSSPVGTSRVGQAILTTTTRRRDDEATLPFAKAEDPGAHQRTGSIAIQKVAASLLADSEAPVEEPPAKAAAVPGSGSGSSDRAPLDVATGARQEAFSGDIAQALATDWVVLAPAGGDDQTCVHLFARGRLVLGKLKEAPVDVCLRNYPVVTYKDSLQKISRQHLSIAFDRIAQQVGLLDLHTANGSLLDGNALGAEHPRNLADGETHVLVVASAVVLWLRARKARTRHPVRLEGVEPSAEADCGLERDHAADAVVITRPENRAELVYAQVLRRVTIGGPGSDLALVGARSLATVEVARYAGRWVWRRTADEPWLPLAAGDVLDCGGKRLAVRPGGYDAF